MANNSAFPGFKGVKAMGSLQAKSNPPSMPKQGSAYKSMVSMKSTPGGRNTSKDSLGLVTKREP